MKFTKVVKKLARAASAGTPPNLCAVRKSKFIDIDYIFTVGAEIGVLKRLDSDYFRVAAQDIFGWKWEIKTVAEARELLYGDKR